MALNVLIAITLSVVTIYFYVNRKSRSKSIEQFQRVCGKFNYDKQSLEQKVSSCNAQTFLIGLFVSIIDFTGRIDSLFEVNAER